MIANLMALSVRARWIIIALVLVQEAASDTKRVALFPPACPTNPDDIARPKAGEEGVCLPVRADPGSSPKTRP